MKQQRQPLRTVVTHEDITALDHCEHLFEMNRIQARITQPPPEQKAAMAAGRAYHRAASTKNTGLREEIIEQELATLPPTEREEVRVEIIEMVKQADSSATTEDAGMRREVQLLWFDPKTEWTFASKPDMFGIDEVIRIKEDKRSRRYYDSHKFQVMFAAFVAAHVELEKQAHLPPNERSLKDIFVTIRCSRFIEVDGVKRRMWEKTFRYPLEHLGRETWLMRERIKLIKRRERSNYFIPKLSVAACSACPRRGECKPLLRNAPLLEKVKAEEAVNGRSTAFPETTAPAPQLVKIVPAAEQVNDSVSA